MPINTLSSHHPAPFVWYDAEGIGRNRYCLTRFAFDAPADIAEATLHCFADARYHLWINGHFLGFGPVRFYPEFPRFDSHDLAAHLRPGRNVIAARIWQPGVPDYQRIHHRAGWCAWGSVVGSDGSTVDLATGNGWKAIRDERVDARTPSFSFAIGPIETVDERVGPRDWQQIDFDDEQWPAAVPLHDQQDWGGLQPRPIPPLTDEPITPTGVVASRAIHDHERHVSAAIAVDAGGSGDEVALRGYACTWLHSPQEQTITIGRWWGEYWLGGEALDGGEQVRKGRSENRITLRAGWNLLVMQGNVSAQWPATLHLGLPHAAGITVSANRDENDPGTIATCGPLPQDDTIDPATWQEPPADWNWRVEPVPHAPLDPCHRLAWLDMGDAIEEPRRAADAFTVAAGKPQSVVYDFGDQQLARIRVHVDAPAGTVVDVGYSQELGADQRPTYYKMVLVHSGERLICGGGTSVLETFQPRGFRFLEVAVSDHDAPVRVEQVEAVSQLYPHQRLGSFRCSDPFVDQLWDMCQRTLEVCSEDVYVDTPWRERGLYGGDMLPEMAAALVVSGDTLLARRSIEIFIESQWEESDWMQSHAPLRRDRKPLLEYPLIVLVAWVWYLRTSGDVAFLHRGYAPFQRLLQVVLENRDERGFFRHPQFTPHLGGPIKKEGTICALQALLVRVWRDWAWVERQVARPQAAAAAEERADDLATMITAVFWNDDVGAFADGIHDDGSLHEQCHPISSYWCSCFGVDTSDRHDRLLAHYRAAAEAPPDGKRGNENLGGPYPFFYLLADLFENEQEGFAEDMVRQFFAPMVEAGHGTVWEFMGPNHSLSHAWSTAPMYYASTRILGVRVGWPDNVDPREILIAPQAQSIDWAEGTVPHPAGPVQVSWRVEGERLHLTARVPRGVPVRVTPRGRLAKLELVPEIHTD